MSSVPLNEGEGSIAVGSTAVGSRAVGSKVEPPHRPDGLSELAGWRANPLEQERLAKLARLEERGVCAYPARVSRGQGCAEAAHAFEQFEAAGAEGEAPTVQVSGRIRRLNIKGKLSFLHIADESGRLQLLARLHTLGEERYSLIKEKLLDVDDFIAGSGPMMRTRAGEISVDLRDLRLLSKALSPLPVIKQQQDEAGNIIEHGAFADIETRYRRRYVDLAVNEEVREVFRRRAAIIARIRQFLDARGFLEVETPILQPLYGGAAARPFHTRHNQLKQELYLRISFELYLKRLLVGGYDAVYEIGRDFRNEGISWKHNPEFTMLEFYQTYIDYRGVMELCEAMVAAAAEGVFGGWNVSFRGKELNLKPSWRRITVREAIHEACGLDYRQFADAETLAAELTARGEPPTPGQPWGKMVEGLLGKYVEPALIQPTFVIDYPREISPFAKRLPQDDSHVERFEAFAGGMEIGNGFSELNDPREQEARFREMAALFQAEDDDSAPLDEDYLRALRYGMPPSGGFGLGIDRLVMLLTDQRSIRDVLLYPHLREVPR
ncbi:MAG: lysine--tRNA ligase [Anaerolineaceae bacterium]|nr:lysine--tRNA ligase [Anaerolineaceae bacterium]